MKTKKNTQNRYPHSSENSAKVKQNEMLKKKKKQLKEKKEFTISHNLMLFCFHHSCLHEKCEIKNKR